MSHPTMLTRPRLSPLASRPKRGFALLITITLLAFLVLLLVSLASLTRVETQVASNNQSLSQARQNALMALNLALGQLQKYTGPDQRVTAAADLASAADGTRLAANAAARNTAAVNGTLNGLLPASATASVQAGTRYWTGVWGRAGSTYVTPAKSIYEETPSPVLLNWLVSGNEDRSFTVEANGLVKTSSSDGRNATGTALFTPGTPVNWSPSGLDPSTPATWSSTSGYSDLEIKTSGQKAVLLVGPNSAGVDPVNGEPASDRYVVAPLQPITVPSDSVGMGSSGNTLIGRYAWWVGDEGIKASYALADPYAGQIDPSTSEQARLRLLSTARSGIELTPNWQDYPAANDVLAEQKLNRVLSLQQASILTPSLTPANQRSAIHDFTRLSRGLITDTLNGGLRQDLTHYFESAAAWNSSPLKGTGIIPAPYAPNWGAGNPAPKWDWLYSFYNTNPTPMASPVQGVRLESGTEVGISPVITQFRFIVFTDRVAMQQPNPNIKYLNANTSYQLPVRCNVVFVLANPYNFTLTAPASSLEFILKNTSTRDTTNSLLLLAGDPKVEYYLLRNPADASISGGLLDTVKFRAPALSIPPGESVTLSVSGNAQIASTPNNVGEPPANIIQLDVNGTTNPVQSTRYFSGATTFDFVTTLNGRSANMAQTGYANISITLRDSGTQKIYQKLQDTGFSKVAAGGLSSQAGTVFGSAHIRLIAPGQRNLDSSTTDQKFLLALYPGGRTYQDYNIRAGSVNPPNVTPSSGTQVVVTPPPYGGGVLYRLSSGNENLIFNAFTQDLHPAPWSENFGQMDAPSINLRNNEAARGVFFDFPRRTTTQLPVMSMAQLQHANVATDDQHPDTTISFQPSYTIGNSYHNAFVTRGSTVQTRNNSYTIGPPGSTRYFDMSYLLNTALWDGYFFSGVPQTGTIFTPLNIRYGFYGEPDETDVRNKDSAAHLLVKGAFNINSTSKHAWVALLGGLNGLRVNSDTTTDGAPFPRTLWQPEDSQSNNNSYQTSGSGNKAYAGYRRLTSAEIDRLAEEIVKRVRARGPFVSLSHFINRSLVAASGAFNSTINDADATGNLAAASVPMGRGFSGTLQAAIDSTASGVNTFQTIGGNVVTANGADDYGDRVLFNGEIVHSTQYKPNYANTAPSYFADKTFDAPHVEWDITKPAPPGPTGRSSTATPGWLLQGDVLQAIGSALSARSDTFVIRAYGEVVNPTDPNDRKARVWCEATVQRIPDYVDSSANQAEDPVGVLSPLNKTFGRGYKVIDFRWLSNADI